MDITARNRISNAMQFESLLPQSWLRLKSDQGVQIGNSIVYRVDANISMDVIHGNAALLISAEN